GFANLQSRQAQYHEDALGWVGGSFRVSAYDIGPGTQLQTPGSSVPVTQFQQICGNILNTAEAAGFQGSYDVVDSTKVNLNISGGDWDLRFVDLNYFANLSQLTDDFFYEPGTKNTCLSDLQDNCVLLPYYFYSNLQVPVNLNDTISAQIVPYSPYNGTSTQIRLKVVGFYYCFPGVQVVDQIGPLVCSSETLKSFLGGTFPEDILFSSNGDVSHVASSLNATYRMQGVYVSTYQEALAQDQSNDYLNYSADQYFSLLYAILLFGEFSLAFATILNNSKDMIYIQRARGETFKECSKLLLWSYGILLAIGIVASILLGFLGAAISINWQTNLHFISGYLTMEAWIKYPLIVPWTAIGWIILLLAVDWSIIMGWFLLRTRNVNLNLEFRQVVK
ncbi:MAG TPA: ABC transporter permease, partial [Candidatus Lokiarchaeia archaeon]|nr:ABC transporter permease [Candidatus Lokiarchaeia archaeon]